MLIRKNWIDWGKTWGIWLVTLGHGGLANEALTQFIFSFHMPFFFLLSGYLYKSLPVGERLRKDFYSLIVPYLLMNGVRFFIWFGVSLWKSRSRGEIFSMTLEHWEKILIGHPMCGPTWFLIALFWVRLIANVVFKKTIVFSRQKDVIKLFKKNTWSSMSYLYFFVVRCMSFISQNKRSFFLVVLSLLSGYLFTRYGVDFPFMINSAIMALPFFGVGIWIQGCKLQYPGPYVVGALVITLLINHYNGFADMGKFVYGNSMVLYYIAGISGSFMLIAFCHFLEPYTNLFVRVISKGTILIMGFNLLAISLVKKLMTLTFPSLQYNGLTGMLISLFILMLFYPFIRVLLRYFPMILGKRRM